MGSPRHSWRAVALAVGLLTVAAQTPMALVAADGTVVASSSSGSSAARSGIALTRPAGTAWGQVMVASITSSDDEPSFAAPAGWRIVRQDTVKDALRQAVYVKVAGPSEPS